MSARNWARWVMCAVMLPLSLVISTAGTANATYGEPAPFSFSEDGQNGVMPWTLSCNGSAAATGDTVSYQVLVQMTCAIDQSYADDHEAGDLTGTTLVTLSGATSTGDVEGCDASVNSAGEPFDFSETLGVFAADCQLSDICVGTDWQSDVFGPDGHYEVEWCGPISVGQPVESTGGCEFGTPMGAAPEVKWVPEVNPDYGHWKMVVIVPIMNMTEPDLWGMAIQSPRGYNTLIEPVVGSSGGIKVVHEWGHWTSNGGGGNVIPVYSVEVYHDLDQWQPDITSAPTYQSGGGMDIPGPGTTIPTGPGQAFHGLTQPEECRFYFGPRLFNVDGTDADDPQDDLMEPEECTSPEDCGVVDETPPPPPPPAPTEQPGCDGFSLTDPTTWAGTAMCAVVKVLLEVWGTLKDALAAIKNLVAGIINGIKGLFVPDLDVMKTEFGKLDDVWDDTAPAKYLDAFSDLTPGAVSGCDGLPLNVELPGGQTVSENLGAACSGSMASAAALVRVVLSAVVVIGGLLGCLRALGAGLGWNLSVGRVES